MEKPALNLDPFEGGVSAGDRIAAGKALRVKVPRTSHSLWEPDPNRPDPVALIEASSLGRLPQFVPVRYARMLQSPFAFYRGSANIMAYDLSRQAKTGLIVQACGDCHLMNFGAYATPERNLVFDVNDFDETLPAPWEWDVKRLAASFVVAGRYMKLTAAQCERAALAAAQAYRSGIFAYSRKGALEIWYSRIDAADVPLLGTRRADRAPANAAEFIVPKLTALVEGHRELVQRPPLMVRLPVNPIEAAELVACYRDTLRDDFRYLFDRYRFADSALKVVGVGSVGTRCSVVLMTASDDDALLLQVKEALPSVLEPYAEKSGFANHGQRVVTGQRLMQAASDVFLGWTRTDSGHDFYIRQLRDMKSAVKVENLDADELVRYAGVCGAAIARAHARSGDPAKIGGYLGRADTFDRALAEFAKRYADQTERDYEAFKKAAESGRIVAAEAGA
jgi:uncharacterized protein (DUF2252 family)